MRVSEEEISVNQGVGIHSLDWMDTLRILRAKVRSFKEDNKRLVRAEEK